MRNEYPCPEFNREEWMSLNGEWNFKVKEEIRKIQVPFVCQSKMSGIGERIKSDKVIYERKFCVPNEWKEKEILLHFGAIDYECRVYINGQYIGFHRGGNTPFKFQITKYLKWVEESIVIEIEDPLSDETIPRGKQFWNETIDFIWYTPSTGIWQSVWLEPVSETRFEFIHFTPDIDQGTVTVDYQLSQDAKLPYDVEFEVLLDKQQIYLGTIHNLFRQGKTVIDVFNNKAMNGSFRFTGLYWTPENPILFDVNAKVKVCDTIMDSVHTYFGMRKVHIENGKFYLNNLPYYSKLILDQGYWKNGLLTAPTDEDYVNDIIKYKQMGFNGCRKHEKVEDPRFLYWADKLGFLVWESMASFWSYTPQAAAEFAKEWCDVIHRDYNHPCIVVWGMLNESWGVPRIYDNKQQQSFSKALYYLAHSLDNTRLVISNDGWEITESDICALHSYKHGSTEDIRQHQIYRKCLKDINEIDKIVECLPFAKGYYYHGEPVMLTEFGGICVGNPENGWGYTNSTGEKDFLETYERILDSLYDSDLICGFCYTQSNDIEQEMNGLLDADHNFKFNPNKIKEINDRKHYF